MESSERIARRFEAARAEGRPALIVYLTAGDPCPERTPSLALALERGGADILELGVPFSDPIADGPVIQQASDRALKAGTTVERVLEIAAEIRRRSEIPIVLFSYLNPLLRYGFDRLCGDARTAGVDGVLVTDLSVEEAEEPAESLRRHGLDRIFLAAPTSTDRRLDLVARYSSGFVYVVSRTGVTGARDTVNRAVEDLVRRLRARTPLPLAVGFGISRREHVEEVGRYADGAVVGSAVMRVVDESADGVLEERLEGLCRELSGKR
ncbi:MAG: tryptophan synthase subunit alpha [Bryobacteraceae bacterium]|nr:tryptophan synthase subunit alpha [Bryobacteraceae bacterium]